MGVENNIPEGWRKVVLGEVAEKIFSGGTPNTRKSEYWNGNYNWLSSGETSSRYINDTTKSISKIGIDNSSTRLALKNDIVIATAGQGKTRGQSSFLKIDAYINQSVIAVRGLKNMISNKWLFYNISLRYNELRFISESNSIRGSLTTKMIGDLIKLNLPPLTEQKAIAKVLTAFDDKIELLQAQNKTLETMAQTIFNEWFGKYQIGDELPEGWRVGSLSEIADFLNGLALQKYPPKKGYETLPVIKIRELKQGITSNTDRANTELDEKYIIDSGDVLFSWSGSLEVVIWQYGKGALNQHLFKVSSEIYPKWFYYHWVLHHLKEFKGIASSKATTMGHINRKHLDLAEVIIPDKETFKKLNFLFSPILEKIENNQNQLQSLTKTRDTLLPKLMSGQVRVNHQKLQIS